jgi:hypothetical protein
MSPTNSPSGPPVIAIPPAVITHVVKAVVFAIPAGSLGWLAYQVAFVDQTPAGSSSEYGLAAVFAAIAVLLALVAIRNVRALFARPEMILTPDGFRLSTWRGVGFLGLFLPHYRMRQHVVAWEDFVQSLNYTHKINGITVEQELRITTRDPGLIAFGWDVFKPNVQRIQRTLLDYIDERFRAPRRAEGRLPEFQRRRWAEPLVLHGDNVPAWLVLALWALTGAFVLAADLGEFAKDWVVVGAFVCGFVAFMLTQHWRRARCCRHVVLGPDGFSVGFDAAKCRVIPWEEIRFVRAHTNANARNDKAASIERVEVRLADGQAVMIEGWNQKDFQRLVDHLEPPLDRLPDVWAQLAQGKGPEAAAQAAGLLARS